MTAAALVPLAFLALMTLIVVLAIRGLQKAKRDDAPAGFDWLPESETYAIPTTPLPPASEPPPAPRDRQMDPGRQAILDAANVTRLPVRLYVVQGGRR
jgi:hypothetical protein